MGVRYRAKCNRCGWCTIRSYAKSSQAHKMLMRHRKIKHPDLAFSPGELVPVVPKIHRYRDTSR